MSHEYDNAGSPEKQPDQGTQAVRGGFGGWTPWTEEAHTKTDIRECTDQSCMSVTVNCSYQGLDHNSHLSSEAAVGSDLRAAWKAKLEGEGKASSGTKSLRDIVFGRSE